MGGISTDAEYRVAVNKMRSSVGTAASDRWRKAVEAYERKAEKAGRTISNPNAVYKGRR